MRHWSFLLWFAICATIGTSVFILVYFSYTPSTAPDLEEATTTKPKNMIVILMDDLGAKDLSYHGSDIPTTYMNEIFETGVEFTNYRAEYICTPGRTSLLTGRHPWQIGMQCHAEISSKQSTGIPAETPSLADLVNAKGAGYKTYFYGKYNAGWAYWDMWPTRKGFDQFVGFHASGEYHRNHTLAEDDTKYGFFKNEAIDFESKGDWDNKIFSDNAVRAIDAHAESDDPFFVFLALQCPHDVPYTSTGDAADEAIIPWQYKEDLNEKCEYYEPRGDTGRYEYCKKLMACDYMIGNVLDRLKETDQWDSTYIFFTSDNGGYQYTNLEKTTEVTPGPDFFGVPPAYVGYSNNWPYRGGKGDFWEGGLRVPTALGGGAVPENLRGTKQDKMTHVTDFAPTMLNLLGQPSDDATLLGVDMLGSEVRDELFLSVRPLSHHNCNSSMEDWQLGIDLQMEAVIYQERYKYLKGYIWADGWYDPDLEIQKDGMLPDTQPCKDSACIYDLTLDPLENTNLADAMPDMVELIEEMIAELKDSPLYKNGQDWNKIDPEDSVFRYDEVWDMEYLWPLGDRPGD